MIGLYLVKLVAFFTRFGATPDERQLGELNLWLTRAETLVDGLIRATTAVYLTQSGYEELARAMRTPLGITPQSPPDFQSAPQTLDQLQERLATCLATYERAEALARKLAMIIALALYSSALERAQVRPRPTSTISVSVHTDALVTGASAPHLWPPPI